MSRLGDMLRKQRTDAALSIKQAAKLCGVAERYLADVEEGRRIIADDVAARMLRKMGLAQPAELEAGADWNAPPSAPEPPPKPQVPKKAPEKPKAEPEDQWLDALSGVLRRVPVLAESGVSQDARMLPAVGGLIEGAPADKAFFVRVSGDALTGYRLCEGDLVLCVPLVGGAIENGALHAVLLNGKTLVRRLTRVEGNRAAVESQQLGQMPRSIEVALADVKVLGKAVRAEFTLG